MAQYVDNVPHLDRNEDESYHPTTYIKTLIWSEHLSREVCQKLCRQLSIQGYLPAETHSIP